MHTLIIDVLIIRLLVLFGCESGKSIFVDIHPERVDSVHKNVDSQIVLITVYQVRLVQVLLNDYLIAGLDEIGVTHKENTFALALVLRLDDEGTRILTLGLVPKVLVVVRQHIRGREEVVIVWQDLLHPHQMAPQHVLTG